MTRFSPITEPETPTHRPDATMTQLAPYPEVLARLVRNLTYRPGWRFSLQNMKRGQGSEGLTLVIYAAVNDSYHPDDARPVHHYMLVPPAAYDERSWRRWLLDQVLLVESHEACEWFQIDRERPYPPSHGPGSGPYLIRDVGTREDAETSFRGVRKVAV